MDIDLLRDFIVLSETRNFTRAAEKLHLTQPTLSKHIVAMEKELGCTLLKRDRRSVELTQEGEALAAAAMQIVETYDDAQKQISAIRNQTPLHVCGIMYDPAISSITAIAGSMMEANGLPPVIYLAEAGESEFLQKLLDDEVDISISYASTEQLEEYGLERIPMTRSRFVAMIDASNPLAQRKEASIDALRNFRFIKFADNYSVCGWNAIAKVCRNHGFTPRSRTVLGRDNSSYINTKIAEDEVVILPNNLPQLRYISDFSKKAVVPLADEDAYFRLFAIYKTANKERVQPIIDAYTQARKIIISHGKRGMLVEQD